MKRQTTLLFLFIFFTSKLFCQSDSSFLNIYYDSDKFELISENQKILEDFFQNINHNSVEKIVLFGHTDSDASDDYNNTLSKNRVDGVFNFLINNGWQIDLLETKYFGEFIPVAPNESEIGKGKNRRVEILLIQKKKKRKIIHITKKGPSTKTKKQEKEIVEEPPKPKKIDPCKKDTTIMLGNGIEAQINICEFKEMEGCLKISAHTEADSLVANGITTYTTAGEPLLSFGMANVETKPGCKTCFKNPIVIRFPVQECPNTKNKTPRVYKMASGSGGRWQLDNGERVRRRTINRVPFYELKFECGGSQNLDIPEVCFVKSKIKTKRSKGKLLEAHIVSDCPPANFPLKVNKLGNAKGDLPESIREYFLMGKLKLKNGDTILIKEPLYPSPFIKICNGKNYCRNNLSLTHFPINRNSQSSFSNDENMSELSRNWLTGSAFTSLEYIFFREELKKDFSFDAGAGIYRNASMGQLNLGGQFYNLKNGIQQVGFSGSFALVSPQIFGGFTTSVFSQLGFGTNFAEVKPNEFSDIIDQKIFNGWGISTNFGITLDSPIFLKKLQVSIGETYNITFTKLARIKTLEYILADPETVHKVKFKSSTKSLIATLSIRYYL